MVSVSAPQRVFHGIISDHLRHIVSAWPGNSLVCHWVLFYVDFGIGLSGYSETESASMRTHMVEVTFYIVVGWGRIIIYTTKFLDEYSSA